MPAVPFAQLPDHSRVWIFGASRPLTSDESNRLLEQVDRFLDGWAAHGAPVVGATVVIGALSMRIDQPLQHSRMGMSSTAAACTTPGSARASSVSRR